MTSFPQGGQSNISNPIRARDDLQKLFIIFHHKTIEKTNKMCYTNKNNLQNADEKGENRMIVYSEVIKS